MYYVYIHRKADTNEVFYIGKGTGQRAWVKYKRNVLWNRIVERHGFVVELATKFMAEEDAFQLEKELVAFYGKRCDDKSSPLANFHDGGFGNGRFDFTEDIRAKISRANSGLSNPRADQTVYSFTNIHTREIFVGSRWELEQKIGKKISDIFKKNLRSINGWALTGSTLKGIYDETIYTFVHRDGSHFTGTRAHFKLEHGFSLKSLFSLSHKQLSCKGWSLCKTN